MDRVEAELKTIALLIVVLVVVGAAGFAAYYVFTGGGAPATTTATTTATSKPTTAAATETTSLEETTTTSSGQEETTSTTQPTATTSPTSTATSTTANTSTSPAPGNVSLEDNLWVCVTLDQAYDYYLAGFPGRCPALMYSGGNYSFSETVFRIELNVSNASYELYMRYAPSIEEHEVLAETMVGDEIKEVSLGTYQFYTMTTTLSSPSCWNNQTIVFKSYAWPQDPYAISVIEYPIEPLVDMGSNTVIVELTTPEGKATFYNTMMIPGIEPKYLSLTKGDFQQLLDDTLSCPPLTILTQTLPLGRDRLTPIPLEDLWSQAYTLFQEAPIKGEDISETPAWNLTITMEYTGTINLGGLEIPVYNTTYTATITGQPYKVTGYTIISPNTLIPIETYYKIQETTTGQEATVKITLVKASLQPQKQ